MFGRKKTARERETPAPPEGVAEISLCVYDDKKRLKHHFFSTNQNAMAGQKFRFLQHPEKALEHMVLAEAVSTHEPATVTVAYGAGLTGYLHVLPFAGHRGKWRYACFQVGLERPDSGRASAPCAVALSEGRVGLLLADKDGMIRSASSEIPAVFGYSAEVLTGMKLSDVFGSSDLRKLSMCDLNTNVSIGNCKFHCLDGAKREVDVKQYTTVDHCTLYSICDVTRVQLNEEITTVTTRERRRIGQDLHDSIGQVVTGISLLSRSLANSLQRSGSPDHVDAIQISELADDASNQIRQISRGLMPSEVVNRGLYPSLSDLAVKTRESCGIDCVAIFNEKIEFNDGAVETHLFRIAQEAVNNAVRHSGGTRIVISMSEINGGPQLEVRDNGRWRNIMESGGGIGLKTMEYRASVIGGHLNIGQGEGGGTSVSCRLEVDDFLETKVM